MEIPSPGEFITYCDCYFPDRCSSPHKHINNPFKHRRTARGVFARAKVPDMCYVRKNLDIWTIFNLDFRPRKTYKIGESIKLFVGDRIAVISEPVSLIYYNNIREVVAKYNCDQEIRFLALEERVAELENFIARHLYYAPDGPGATNAADEFRRLSAQ